MEDLLLFPFSGTAMEALDCLGTEWNPAGFISDDAALQGTTAFGIPVYDRSAFERFAAAKVLAVHGSPSSYRRREAIIGGLGLPPERFATVVHPRASVGTGVKLGRNVLIMAGVVITANAAIGDHVIILPNSVVHHDSQVGDLTLVAANVTVAGNVRIGKNCYIGAASSLKNGISLGDRGLVGMAANVVASWPEDVVLVGNPAKPK